LIIFVSCGDDVIGIVSTALKQELLPKLHLLLERSLIQYDAVISRCKELFWRKNKDYGTAWRVLRLSSLTDQIYIKASHIRNIEVQGSHKVDYKIEDEYIGIINYCLLTLVQHYLEGDDRQEIPTEELSELYDRFVIETRQLFERENHDYREIWLTCASAVIRISSS